MVFYSFRDGITIKISYRVDFPDLTLRKLKQVFFSCTLLPGSKEIKLGSSSKQEVSLSVDKNFAVVLVCMEKCPYIYFRLFGYTSISFVIIDEFPLRVTKIALRASLASNLPS